MVTMLWYLLFISLNLIKFIAGYEPCGDINIYSFGNALNTDFLGQYTQHEHKTHSRHSFTMVANDKAYKLWWAHFRNRVSRWSIGLIVDDESSVIAYKDSHALHPSEIARQRSLWKVYDRVSDKWMTDQSLHVKCNDALSAFEWKQDCLVLGVTNAYDAVDTLDYLQIDDGYYSASTGHKMTHDGTDWKINNKHGSIIASIATQQQFPNAIDNDKKWILNNRESSFMSVHCEVPSKGYYYQSLREEFEVCRSQKEAACAANLDNVHFNTVVMKESDEWSFGITDDWKYFTWNETMDSDGNKVSHKIASVGIGTAGINNDRDVITWAVNEYNYELIDSASDHAPWYQNEHIIGKLLKRNILKRDSFLVTTKLYEKDQGLYGAKHGLDDSLTALNVDYIDIYLIHHPHCGSSNNSCQGSWKTSWRVIEDYYFENKIKYVGASNFDINQFHELLDWTKIPVSVVQNWFDPFRQNDRNILEECKKLGIIYQAYSLLGTQWKYIARGYRGNKDPVFTNAKLKEIAQRYEGKSVAQIVLRWALQNKIAVLPSSTKKHRIEENMDIFDFELDEKDMEVINQIK